MSYLVLARKWRPQTFRDLVGQEHVSRTLANAFASRRVPRVPVHGRARLRQDHERAHPRQGAQLRDAAGDGTAKPCGTCARVHEHRARQRGRRPGDRRRQQQRHRRDPRPARGRALPARVATQEDLHHRRSPHALDRGVQRVAEDARGAAAARDVHLRDDRGAQGAGHDPVALPALRLQARAGVSAGAAPDVDLQVGDARRSMPAPSACSCANRAAACAMRSRCATRSSPTSAMQRSRRRMSPRCSASPIAR